MTDPTLQSQGRLLVTFRNAAGSCWIAPGGQIGSYYVTSPNPPTYGPPNQPPPEWTQGKQWYAQQSVVPLFGFPVQDPNGYTYPCGLATPVIVADMSAQTVLTGKMYYFTIGVLPLSVQLYVAISGVAGGSVVLPGFGLYNLLSNPHAWTYVTPSEFTGSWAIDVNCPTYATALTLSVDYVPRQGPGGSITWSRLNFAATAGGQQSPIPPTGEAVAAGEPAEPAPAGPLEIIGSSTPHVLVDGPAAVAPPTPPGS